MFLINSVPRWCKAWSCCPWPATVVLVLLPQPFSIHHGSSDTKLAGAYEPINLDGFVSPHHPPPVMQICHWVCPFFRYTSHLKKVETCEPDTILGCIRNNLHPSTFCLIITWILMPIIMSTYLFWKIWQCTHVWTFMSVIMKMNCSHCI